MKAIKNALVFSLVAVAALLLFFSGKTADVPPKETTEEISLERRLEEILSGVKGAGKVDVLVVYKDDGKESIAMNTEYSEDSDGRVKSQKTAVMSSGKEAVVVSKSIPQVQGVIVIAQGAEDENIRKSLKAAVEAALPVMPHRSAVLAGE